MSHIHSNRRKPSTSAVITALALLLACLGLAACGGSSSSTTATSANASATTPKGATGLDGRLGARAASRFKTIRECMQKNGVTLPQRPPGQRRGGPSGPSGASGFLGGGAGGTQLPSGVTRAQYEAAIKKCGGGSGFRRGTGRLKAPVYKAALSKFAACMRENGVNVPAPNTSGSGPVFNIKGLKPTSSKFQSAEAKCRSDLFNALRQGRPSTGASGAAGPQPQGGPATG